MATANGKRPWIAALLALTLGGPGCFYLGWRRGVTATLVWLLLVWFVVVGAVRQNSLDPYSAALDFFLLWVIQAPLACLAYSSCKRRNAEAAGTARSLDASQQLRIIGVLVIALSGIVLLIAALITAEGVDDKITITDALLICVPVWGLATGVGLLLLRPWARLSSLVFYVLLCIAGALSAGVVVVRIFTNVWDVVDAVLTAPFALTSVTMGVLGLRFFKRNDIRHHFGES